MALTTKKTLNMLLVGKSKEAKKYAGKHVLVVKDKIVPLKEKTEDIWQDIEKLKKKYKEMPTITFVPRRDVSYILSGAKNTRFLSEAKGSYILLICK